MEQGLLKKFPICCASFSVAIQNWETACSTTNPNVSVVAFCLCNAVFNSASWHGPLICLPQSIFFIQFRATFSSQTAIYMLFNNIWNTNMLQNVFLNNCDANGLKIFTGDSPSVCKGLCQITPHPKITRIKLRLCWIPGC